MNALIRIAHLVAAAGEPPRQDSEGITSHSWILPETAEMIYGILAALIIFGLLLIIMMILRPQGFLPRKAPQFEGKSSSSPDHEKEVQS